MTTDTTNLDIRRDDTDSRFEVVLDGQRAELSFTRLGDHITFHHTRVPKALEGQGIAGRMAHDALEYARAEGLRVEPQCPYVRSYIERHPEYQDLVAR